MSHDSWANWSDDNFRVALDTFYHFFEIMKIIWERMCKLNHIFIDSEVILETESFIIFFLVVLIMELILIIIDIKTFSPPCFLIIFIAFLGSNDWLHTILIQWFWFILHKGNFTKFTMLNLATKLFRLLCTLKLNHWVKPWVFVSFWRIKSYVFVSVYIKQGKYLEYCEKVAGFIVWIELELIVIYCALVFG